jgi:hypothetical protein
VAGDVDHFAVNERDVGRGNKPRAPGVASWMNTTIAPFGARRLASIGAFVAGATTLWANGAYESLRHASIAWESFGVAALVGAAAYGFGRASALAQVLARAVGWAVLAPAALILGSEAARHGQLDGWTAALVASTTLGLAVSRPLLETDRARRDFHPVAVRRALLSGSIASIAVALWVGLIGVRAFESHHVAFALELGVLAAGLAGSAAGIVRMRGWGVLLAGLTSLALVVESVLTRDYMRSSLALAALPGAFLAVSVAFARWWPTPDAEASSRVADLPPVRMRVAMDEELFDDALVSNGEAIAAGHPAGATVA